MDRLKQRIAVAEQALETLQTILREPETDIVRDASIQRFEYTFEAVWKAAQLYLRRREGLEAASPKAVIRAAGQVRLLDDNRTAAALAMADDRNLTVHMYNKALAEALYSKLPSHAKLMEQWLGAMNDRIG
jgi:nucleotidyltransferase substrate binding protein (TIGR01987 family)